MTLRVMIAVAVTGFLLAVSTGCGGENASSPNGPELAYLAEQGQSDPSGIFLVDRQGKHRRRLTRRPVFSEAEVVSWSPRSDLLLFQSVAGEIWTIRSDGTDPTKIADGSSGASWSPDGQTIAAGAGDAIEILSAEGEVQKRISLPGEPERGILSAPSWSPDGTRVAFAAGSKGYKNTAPFMARVRGHGPAMPLTKPRMNEIFQHTPFWSPDGKLLAFESDEFQIPSIWTIRPDGSQRKRVANGASLFGWAPGGRGVLCRGIARESWSLHECPLNGRPWRRLAPEEEKRAQQRDRYSPDGRQLAHVALSGAIVVSRADGSQPGVLTDAGPYNCPQWSPDGERLAFVRDRGASEDDVVQWVYVIGRNGKGARRLVRGGFAVWLPDDAGLVVQRELVEDVSSGLFVATLEGKTRMLAKGLGNDYFEGPVLSVDGATVAYMRPSQTKTVYVIPTAGGRERKVVDVPGDVPIGDLAWSSDGQALLVVWPDRRYPEDYDERFATLFEVDLSGSKKIVATAVDLEAGIGVSPSDGRVAFVGTQGLEVVDPKTRKRRTLLRGSDQYAFSDPQWSDDGSTLAYLANDAPGLIPSGLETVGADGSGRKRISLASELAHCFSWRPTEARD